MKITRENYANFMMKVIPLLTAAYFIQAYFYLKYAPQAIAQEVVGCLGVALVGIFIYYFVYDRFYQVVLHPNYFEIRFDPLKMRMECFYREIADVEIVAGKKSYHHLKIHLRNGETLKIAHVDDAYTVRKFLLERA